MVGLFIYAPPPLQTVSGATGTRFRFKYNSTCFISYICVLGSLVLAFFFFAVNEDNLEFWLCVKGQICLLDGSFELVTQGSKLLYSLLKA